MSMLSRLAKPAVWFLCLVPFLYLLSAVIIESLYPDMLEQSILGANPVEFLTHETGAWSLRLLLLTLAMTPLRQLSGSAFPIRIRRMLGLYAFFYVSLHFLIYAVLDLGLDWSHLGEDILERPFITIGFLAWLCLIPLAVTSTNAMMRRLGKRWKRLHRLVYLIGALACVHFIWLVKKDLLEPLIYIAIFVILMLFRLPRRKAGLSRAGTQAASD